MKKNNNKGKRALTAMGAVVAAGLTPGFIVASAAGSSIQNSNAGYGGLCPNDFNSNDEKVEESIIYSCVEQMPQFPGGEAALMKYFKSHILYPYLAAEDEVQGRVVVRFIVDETGKVSNATVIHSADYYLDREVVRACKELPKFIPGRHNGQAVSVWYTLPVTFSIRGKRKTTAANAVTIDGKTYSFDELYAKQHPDIVNMDGSLPEVIVTSYPNVTRYGPVYSRPLSYDYDILEGDTVYYNVERMPRFPIGEKAVKEYIESHIQYPANAIKNRVQGCVFVNYVIEKTGKISNVRVVRSVDKELDEEAVRLVKTLPFIPTPGRHKGKAVSVWRTEQVIFKLPEE